jgi:hypothetical protein
MNRRSDPPFSFSSPAPPRRRLPRWIWKALAAVVLLGAAGAWLYHDPSLVEPYLRGTPLELPARTTRIYRWKDTDGTWVHSNSLPPAGVSYEIKEISSDTNIISLPSTSSPATGRPATGRAASGKPASGKQ